MLAIIAFSTVVNAAEWPKADFKDCGFYTRVENILNCQPQGHDYLVNYGFRYCEEFKKQTGEWSDQAKKWVQDTGQCLQEMLSDNRANRIAPCSQLEEFAFDVHPICYKQYGICKLPLTDKYNIITTVRGVDYLSRRSFMQGLNVALSCINEMVSIEENATFNRVVASTSSFSDQDRLIATDVFYQAPKDSISSRREYFRYALSLLIGDMNNPASRSTVEMYANYYGRISSITTNDKAFFTCGKAIASGAGTKDCDASLARDFRNLTPTQAKKIGETLTITKVKAVIKQLKWWSSGTKK